MRCGVIRGAREKVVDEGKGAPCLAHGAGNLEVSHYVCPCVYTCTKATMKGDDGGLRRGCGGGKGKMLGGSCGMQGYQDECDCRCAE